MKTPPSAFAASVGLDRVDPKWAWHRRTLLGLRQKLSHTQAEHEKIASAPAEARGIDSSDAAQDEFEHGVILAEMHVEANRLAEIDAALQRLGAGTYGICEATGEEISPERLRAIPWTRLSRSAAERQEQLARQNRGR